MKIDLKLRADVCNSALMTGIMLYDELIFIFTVQIYMSVGSKGSVLARVSDYPIKWW